MEHGRFQDPNWANILFLRGSFRCCMICSGTYVPIFFELVSTFTFFQVRKQKYVHQIKSNQLNSTYIINHTSKKRRWYSGMMAPWPNASIRPCHGWDPGSIPGRRTFYLRLKHVWFALCFHLLNNIYDSRSYCVSLILEFCVQLLFSASFWIHAHISFSRLNQTNYASPKANISLMIFGVPDINGTWSMQAQAHRHPHILSLSLYIYIYLVHTQAH